MTEKRFALIIANYQYDDTDFQKLIAPAHDAEALTQVLKKPDFAGFQVTTLINESADTIRRKIAHFFANKTRDDLLLLYFSGHGVLDNRGHLWLSVKDTERNILSGTAIPTTFITDEMDGSYSQRQVLILDCCNSGAFERGSKGTPGAIVGTSAAFEGKGRGRFVMTATDSTQYAWEGNQVTGEAKNSVFTKYLIKGLEGEAANDKGWITVDSLHDYVYEHVVEETPKQTPCKWTYKEKETIVLARGVVKRKPLPQELLDAKKNPIPKVREGVVAALEEILLNTNKGLALSAYNALQFLSEDDSRMVSKAAEEVLAKTPDWIIKIESGPKPKAKEELEEEISELSSQAKKLFEERRYAKAIAKWQEVLKLDFENSEAIEGREEAKRILEEINKLDITAQQLCKEEKYSEAIDAWEKVLDLDPENQTAKEGIEKAKGKLREKISKLSSQAQKLFEEKRYAEAIAKWQEVLKLDSENRKAIKGKEEADQILKKIKQLYDEGTRAAKAQEREAAIAAFRELVTLDSQYRDVAARLEEAKEKLQVEEEIKNAEVELKKEKLGAKIAPVWKWGSMIASLVLLFISWMYCMDRSYDEEILVISLIFGFPATIYLMYKERTEKIKYGLAWILFPILISPFGLSSGVAFVVFLVSAIIIDAIFVYKLGWKWGSMIASFVYKLGWKWGSMIASFVLLFIFLISFYVVFSYSEEVLRISLIFGFPATIYLMYKERTERIKYGLAWILFPIMILLLLHEWWDRWYWYFIGFFFSAIPAIVIDVIYVYTTRLRK